MKDEINMGMNIPAVKGHCKIELFENGEKVKEIEQDNYVHPKYLGALNKFYSYRAFQFGEASFSGVLPNSNRIGASIAASNIPFRGLLLTDAVHAEDPEKERAVKGKIIAMSALNDNNSPQSPYRGRYNTQESEHTLEYHKFVYDFREDEANGVIGSVYTVPGWLSGSTTMVMDGFTLYSQSVSGLASGYGVAYVDDDFIYFGHRDTAPTGYQEPFPAEIYRVAKSDVPNVTGAVEVESIYMPVRPVRGITEKDGRLYMWGHVSQSDETDLAEVPVGHTFIVSAPSNDITNVRVEKLWNRDEISAMIGYSVSSSSTQQQYYTRCMGDFFYDADNDQFMLMYKGVTSSDYSRAADTIYVLDSSFNLVSSSGGKNKMSRSNFYDRDTVFMADHSRDIHAEDLSDLSTVATMRWGNVGSTYRIGTVRPYNEFFDIIAESRTSFQLAPAAHFFSRVLLTQPINKTNMQTMKITYEFTREPLSFEHIDDGSKYTPTTPTELHIHPVTVITPEKPTTPQTTPEHQHLLDALPEHRSSTNTNVIVTIKEGTKWLMYHSADPLVSETGDVDNKLIPGGTWDYYYWTGTEWKFGNSASTDLIGHGYIVYTAVDIVEQGTGAILVPAGGNTVE